MQLDDFVDLLEGVKVQGGGYIARCPAHEDRSPSLSVTEGDEGILVKCHAGCLTEAVVEALGLEMKDLFFESSGSFARDEPTVYVYEDEEGVPLFEVVRFPDKRFSQRLPCSEEWGVGDVRKVLWRLPRILGAPKDKRIFFVEGEKDVLSIEALGSYATTAPGGAAASWNPEWSQTLKGRHVWIIADRDEPGRKHARKVAEALEGVAASVEIRQAREGKDATDHLDAGYGLDDFVPMNDEPTDGVVFQRLDQVEARDVEWIEGYENMFAFGATCLLVGLPGVNKSTMACRVAAAVTEIHGKNVVFLSSEDSPGIILRPRLQLAGADIEKCYFAGKRQDGEDSSLYFPADVVEFSKRIEKIGNVGLVIIDPVGAHIGGETDSNADPSVRRALAPLARMAAKYGCCVLMVHHLNKGRSRNLITRVGGSIGFYGVSRQVVLMAKSPNAQVGHERIVAGHKNNWGAVAGAREYILREGVVDGHAAITLSGGRDVNYSVESLLADGTGGGHE